MAIINRVSRLFTADIHAVLDRLEEPEVLLRQAVREMEDEAAKFDARLRKLKAESERLRRDENAQAKCIEQLDVELDLCFESHEEALARTLVKRKLAEQARLETMRQRIEKLDVELTSARRRHQEQQAQLSSIRQKAELVAEENQWRNEHTHVTADTGVSEDEIDVALLKEKHRRKLS